MSSMARIEKIVVQSYSDNKTIMVGVLISCRFALSGVDWSADRGENLNYKVNAFRPNTDVDI